MTFQCTEELRQESLRCSQETFIDEPKQKTPTAKRIMESVSEAVELADSSAWHHEHKQIAIQELHKE